MTMKIRVVVLAVILGASIAHGADIEIAKITNERGLTIGMKVVSRTMEKTRGMARQIVETWGQPDERSEDGLRATWIKDAWEMEMVADPDGSAVFTMMGKQVTESRESPVDNYEEELAARINGEQHRKDLEETGPWSLTREQDIEEADRAMEEGGDPLDRQNRAVEKEMADYIERTRRSGWDCGPGRIWIDSYTKRDGTRVSGHCRSLPNR